MVYIPFPRIDLDTDTDLQAWRNIPHKKEGDWKALRNFLNQQPRLKPENHAIPKCWYTELPQGDAVASDVEHFRPKNSGEPLSVEKVKELEKLAGVDFFQNPTSLPYKWLEHDYRNYRFVTALPNRSGAKHIYFPVVNSTDRLKNDELPWIKTENAYFLDPTNAHDANLLLVLPDGSIAPKFPKIALMADDISKLPDTWDSHAFNYIRAYFSIKMYRLNEKILQEGRKEVYNKLQERLVILEYAISESKTGLSSETVKGIIKDIGKMLLPSAPFALAARCALIDYKPMGPKNQTIIQQILDRILAEVSRKAIDWDKP